MNKKERLERIRRFVDRHAVKTQEEIVEHLREAGLSATQATVSRDIRELGIVKIPLKDNTYIYELPKSIASSLDLVEKNVLSHALQENMINLTLIPGSSTLVKRHLLGRFREEIFSILADNDSILIISPSNQDAKKIYERIRHW
ncbi:arginine repressor [Streptococcus oricebi]|uniref:Arginine repressor n=1 Tax=Streptococcus oricebi TaxID=1547447 RepID=A0ABS5B1H9_9STRE|nr:arginine repressor [Streptococcus oricebi]MBP2622692.1 arginine repressor [Streptococcus oricebi]